MVLDDIQELKKRLAEVYYYNQAIGLLHWDKEVKMPPKAINSRSKTVAYLGSVTHSKFISIDSDGLLTSLKKKLDAKKIKGKNKALISEVWRSFQRDRKLPEKFIREQIEITSKAQNVWAEAREKNCFSLFLPWLIKIVKLKREEAKLIGYKNSPYDVLLDIYEPNMTAEETSKVLNDSKDFLVPFLKEIKKSKVKIKSDAILGNFPLDKQFSFCQMVSKTLGFDLEAGRIDTSVHPFATGFHPLDVRLTTRYKEDDVLYSIGPTIHETGHALYEQGLRIEHYGTPLGDAISLGIHESQSRMYENIVGKSREFWKFFYPKLWAEFPKPFKNIPLDDFYKIINEVKPSLIRVEADEVTYNLHIILRFEIEKGLIEGTIEPEDLPKIWNSKMKDYLGIDIPNDAMGVLQDVHWSSGSIGYFPTYAFGNLYSAQFYEAMKKDIPDIAKKISNGRFKEMREWLRENIHAHGKLYTAEGLVKKVTGEPMNSKYWNDYIEKKYREIYEI